MGRFTAEFNLLAHFLLHTINVNRCLTLSLRLLCLLTLYACGKGYEDIKEIEEEVAPGHYKAVFKSLNSKVGRFNGWLSLSIHDNQFWARVKVSGPNTKSMHAQYIHTIGTCPDMDDDLNHDGYLDFMEVYNVAGPILLPLDSNLNSQLKGLDEFPKMRENTYFYYYSEACQSTRLLSDLKEVDVFGTDMMAKLGRGENLNLATRVIIIYGSSEGRPLPETVRSFEGYPSQSSIPIACGEITEGVAEEFDL
jgi:hypothetical protein